LPQTQCGQCGYPGCKPYAEALANGDKINKCVPGGDATMRKIADLMGVEPQSLDGGEDAAIPVKKVAFIHEDMCIGCTKSPPSALGATSASTPARPTVSK
jgi:electron transport complex protein RnfB